MHTKLIKQFRAICTVLRVNRLYQLYRGGLYFNMQVEVGSVVKGKVTGITNFGAFVEIASGETGMVHISEVSNSYVKEIADFLTPNQEVKVKILSVTNGKISLSMKQCEPKPDSPSEKPAFKPSFPKKSSAPRGIIWQPKDANSDSCLSFEDKMTKFKQVSNDRMTDLKRANEPKRSRRSAAK